MDEQLLYIPEPKPEKLLPPPERSRFSKRRAFFLGLFPLAALFGLYVFFCMPPSAFPVNTAIVIAKGETLSQAASNLRTSKVIRSEFAFKVFMVVFGGSKSLVAGSYFISEKQNAAVMAWRLSNGLYDLKAVKVTLPEGKSVKEMAGILSANVSLTEFNASDFLRLAASREGYLFPDTYLFLPTATAQDIKTVMEKNYKERIASIASEIAAFGRSEKDVVIMASILEKEAAKIEDKELVAGILWKRLDQGMPLQVDATFAFVNGKTKSIDLTLDDLKIESPYNTYVNKGLPPGPISNPGLVSIRAAIHPKTSPYYFYLSDSAGIMHYAITLDEHVVNKGKYLK